MCVDEKGRKALTYYKVLERYPEYTLCEFKLHTGRTHQIRVHANTSTMRWWAMPYTAKKINSALTDSFCTLTN